MNIEANDLIIITVISDTHGIYKLISQDLPPKGDILIHCGDATFRGTPEELKDFCNWFSSIPNYKYKFFIPGNNDFMENPQITYDVLKEFSPPITCLHNKSESIVLSSSLSLKIHGIPARPCLFRIKMKYLDKTNINVSDGNLSSTIPDDVDILITHEPPFGVLDISSRNNKHGGEKWLMNSIMKTKPKIHLFGHIHESHGHVFSEGTHFFNASVVDSSRKYSFKPISFKWDPKTNSIQS